MSQIVPLDAAPNQALSIQLDNIRYDLRFRDLGDIMSVDISINDDEILTGQLVVGGSPLIPYKYLESDGGNFIFSTELGDIPYWQSFGVTQLLFYFSSEELEVIRAD